jgi:hypothetical protein
MRQEKAESQRQQTNKGTYQQMPEVTRLNKLELEGAKSIMLTCGIDVHIFLSRMLGIQTSWFPEERS